MGSKNDDAPYNSGIGENHEGQFYTGFFYTVRSYGAVIIAYNRGRSFIKSMNRCFDHLANAGYNRHDGKINISTNAGKNGIAANGDETVGELHYKTCTAESYNVFGIRCACAKFRKM